MENSQSLEVQLPPYNLEAETAVLGAILIGPTAIFNAMDIIEPGDFYNIKNQYVYKGMVELHKKDAPIDLITLAEQLKSTGETERAGGAVYLSQLMDAISTAANIDHHAGIVRGLAQRRQLIALTRETERAARDIQQPIDELVSAAEQKIFDMTRRPGQKTSGADAQWGENLAHEVLKAAALTEEARKEGRVTGGIKTGFNKLDKSLNGLCPGRFYMLAAGTGAGKTTLCLQFAMRAAKDGFPAIYVSYENSADNLILKAVCAEAEISTNDVERGYADLGKLNRAANKIAPALGRLMVITGTSSLTVSRIKSYALQAMKVYDTESCLVVFDYLQRAAHGMGYEQLRHNVSRLSGDLCDLAKRLNSPVLAISSQSRKGHETAELTSLKESGDLEYDVDAAMFLVLDGDGHEKDDPVRPVKLVVAKNRHGITITEKLIFHAQEGRFRQR